MEEKIYIIDLNHLDSDEVYGVKNIAFTKNPAIKLTGLALSDIEKQLIFEDEKKMQICAPLLVPMKVYRYDNKDGDFYVQFTEEVIERVAKNMMKNLSMSGQESIFTNEHTDQKLNAYIFELMLVDNEKKQSFIKENYNYDMPLGGVWLTVQCDDAETYDYIVENKKMGFSIDGLFPLKKLQKQINMSKEEKKIELELEEGKKYVVKDGELVLEEAPKEEPKEEPEKESKEELEKEEPEKEVKEELEEEPEPKDEPTSEVLTKATLSEALTPLIDAISELKAEIVNAKADAVEDTTVQMTDEEKPKYKFALQWILGR